MERLRNLDSGGFQLIGGSGICWALIDLVSQVGYGVAIWGDDATWAGTSWGANSGASPLADLIEGPPTHPLSLQAWWGQVKEFEPLHVPKRWSLGYIWEINFQEIKKKKKTKTSVFLIWTLTNMNVSQLSLIWSWLKFRSKRELVVIELETSPPRKSIAKTIQPPTLRRSFTTLVHARILKLFPLTHKLALWAWAQVFVGNLMRAKHCFLCHKLSAQPNKQILNKNKKLKCWIKSTWNQLWFEYWILKR